MVGGVLVAQEIEAGTAIERDMRSRERSGIGQNVLSLEIETGFASGKALNRRDTLRVLSLA